MSDYVPPELIVEILLNLPVKSLIRFTAICKSWQSVITSRSFISSHFDKPKNQTILLKVYDTTDEQHYFSLLEIAKNNSSLFCINSFSELELPFKSQSQYSIIVGSCRGIICLSDKKFSCLNRPVLWNPSLKQHLVLPYGCIPLIEPDDYCVLGFGATDNDFKVARLVCKSNAISLIHEAEVFSLKTRRWRRLTIAIGVEFTVLQFIWFSQVFLNGVVHWLGYAQHNDGAVRRSVLAFRVEEEVFSEITFSYELAKEPVAYLSLTSVGESLAMIMCNGDVGNRSCDVWLMKEYGVESSWSKCYSFLLLEGMNRVLALRKNGEALVASHGNRLVALDLASGKTKNFGTRGTYLYYVNNYVESLESLKCESENSQEVVGAEEDLI